MKISNVLAASPVSPSQWLARMRCPVDETGMNSVTPSIRPRSAAVSRTSPLIGSTHRGVAPQHLLVDLLVHRHDAIGGELPRLGDGRLAHGGGALRVTQQLDGTAAHGLDRAYRLQDAVHAVVDHLG